MRPRIDHVGDAGDMGNLCFKRAPCNESGYICKSRV